MTDEYISREKTLELLKSLSSRDYRRKKGTIQDAIKMISYAVYTPAADVAPVRHGRWIYHDDGVFTCSECGNAESNDSYYCRLRCTVKRQSALVRLVFAQQECVERRRNHGFDGGNRLYAVIRGQDHV